MAETIFKKDKQSNNNIKRLATDHKIHIPDGINYDKFEKKYHAKLMALEQAIWPFKFLTAKLSISQSRLGWRIPYYTITGVVVDTKSFHCTMGVEWNIEDTRDIKEWARRCAIELIEGYKNEYKL